MPLTNPGLPVTIQGKTYYVSILDMQDIGNIERWIFSEYGQLTSLARGVGWQFLSTTFGAMQVYYYSLKKNHPEVTVEWLGSLSPTDWLELDNAVEAQAKLDSPKKKGPSTRKKPAKST